MEKQRAMKKTEIFFPIEPRPKGRPRFTRYGHAYTPDVTKEYEENIRNYYIAESSDYYECAIKLELSFYLPIPKSTSKKKQRLMEQNVIKHVKKPDVDNLCKSVCDALNGVCWRDDSMITEIISRKMYATENNVGIHMVIRQDVE